MGDLPDLNTDEISFVSYWNAIDDGGASEIEPSDVLDNDNITESTLYDNGVEVKYYWEKYASYADTEGREVTARVKTDGWFVVYLDRTYMYGSKSEGSAVHGPWDIITNWYAPRSSASFDPLNTEDIIEDLADSLSNSGMVDFNASDCGLYNYEYPDVENITCLSSGENNPTFTYTEGTDIEFAVAFGVQGYNENTTDYHPTNEELIEYGDTFGTLDITDSLTQSGEEYAISASATYPTTTILFFWS